MVVISPWIYGHRVRGYQGGSVHLSKVSETKNNGLLILIISKNPYNPGTVILTWNPSSIVTGKSQLQFEFLRPSSSSIRILGRSKSFFYSLSFTGGSVDCETNPRYWFTTVSQGLLSIRFLFSSKTKFGLFPINVSKNWIPICYEIWFYSDENRPRSGWILTVDATPCLHAP